MTLEYKGHIFNHGDYIEGTIHGKPIAGHINTLEEVEQGRYFFCQDFERGNECEDKLGHKYSWIFSLLENNSLGDNVEIFIPDNSQKEIKFTEDKFSRVFVKTFLDKGKFSYSYYSKFSFNFTYKSYPRFSDCHIIIPIFLHNELDTLKENIKAEVISNLVENISKIESSNFIVQVPNSNSQLLSFLEEDLNFYRSNIYKSKYSGEVVNCLTKNL